MTIVRLTTALLFAALLSCTSVLAAHALEDPYAFSDVPRDHPHYAAIDWVSWNDIADGYPDGTFRPEQPVTRGQMATMLQRYHLSLHGHGVAPSEGER